MSFARALRCRECGREYPLEPIYVCEFCFGSLEVDYDYSAIKRQLSRGEISHGPRSLARYRALLPVDGEMVDIGAGLTPLTQAKNLGKALGLNQLYVKNDCLNPTYSFKDRVVSVATTKAREFGFEALACASTGNLACSVAAHGGKAGMKAYVLVPADLEMGKIIGAAIYHPTLVGVEGNYDDVNRLCSELTERFPWAFVNINIRPYYAEGCKTIAYEAAEQLEWRAPDCAIVPVASGSLFNKIWKGWQEMERLGLIGAVRTRMYVAQATGCSPIATAYFTGSSRIKPVKPKTIAKSLAIGNPADGYYALKTIKASAGGAATASEEEIVEGIKLLAETEGIFAETAGGVTVAALKHLAEEGIIKRDELTVAFITGAGPKTLEAVEQHVVSPIVIKPTVKAFEEALGLSPALNQTSQIQKKPRGGSG